MKNTHPLSIPRFAPVLTLLLLGLNLHALTFTNSPLNTWRYSELLESNPNDTSYFPSSTNEYSQAVVQGYVTFEDDPGAGPVVIDENPVLGYQILTTWVKSGTNQTLNLAFNGDDGHSLFVDGLFMGGAGFGVPVSNSVSFTANVPRKLELAVYNSVGGWAGYIGLGPWNGYVENNWSNLLETVPSLTLNADGFSISPSQPLTNLIVNGSFEDPALASNTGAYVVPTGWTWTPGLASAPALAGGVFSSDGAQYGPAEDGQQWLGLGSAGDGSLSQVITLPTSGSYQLTWYAIVGNEGQASSPSPYRVSFGNTSGQFDAGTSLAQSWEPQSLAVTNLAAGQYTLTFTPETVQGGFATIIDNVALVANPVNQSPAITQQPTNLMCSVGANAVFSVTASGASPLSFQWQFAGTNLVDNGQISGSLSNQLTLINVSANDAGNYAVIVSNAYGAVTSTIASLTVSNLLVPATNMVVDGSFETPQVSGPYIQYATGAQPGGVWTVVSTADVFEIMNAADPYIRSLFDDPTPAGNQFAYSAGSSTVLSQDLSAPLSSQSTYTLSLLLSGFNGGSTAATASITPTGSTNVVFMTSLSATNWSMAETNFTVPSDGLYTLTLSGDFVAFDNVSVVVSGPAPPTIVVGPQSQIAEVGSPIAFKVTASGSAPIFYQWQLDGTNLSDTTRIRGSSGYLLSISNVLSSDAGNYNIIVSNAYGTVTSTIVSLTVTNPNGPLTNLLVNGSFETPFIGANTYQDGTVPTGWTSPDPANFQIINSSGSGWTYGGTVFEPPAEDGQQYADISNNSRYWGCTLSQTVSVAVAGNYVLSWYDNVPYEGAAAPADYDVVMASTGINQINSNYFSSAHFAAGTSTTNNWNYQSVQIALQPATYTLTFAGDNTPSGYSIFIDNVSLVAGSALTNGVPPTIVPGPQSQAVELGVPATFQVTASGTAPLFYRWQFNGTNLSDNSHISGSTSNLLRLNSTFASDAGQYDVVVSNGYGMATSAVVSLTITNSAVGANLVQNPGFETGDFSGWTVISSHRGPVIINAPHTGSYAADWGELSPGDTISQAIPTVAGMTYEFSFWLNTASSGDGPYFSASWAGNQVLTVQPPASFGWSNYVFTETATGPTTISFTAYDPPGGLQLDDVSVQLGVVPIISAPPSSQTTGLGAVVSFSVAASGTSPFFYQWQFDGANLTDNSHITGSTSNLLTINGALASDAGGYDVVVSNAYGAVTSSIATLSFPTPISLQNATATLSQTPGFSPSAAIDGILTGDAGWALPSGGSPATIVFQTTADVGYPGGALLTFGLQQGRSLASYPNFQLGRFRLSATTADRSTYAHRASNGGNVGTNWTVLAPVSAVASDGTTFQIQADSSILATKSSNSSQTSYIVIVQTSLTNITGFRLEAMTNSALPANGPGLSSSGNLVLQEFQVGIQPAVSGPPVIFSQPFEETLSTGSSNVTFQIQALGNGPFSYQWQFNGVNLSDTTQISGVSSNLLTIVNPSNVNAGTYDVIIASPYGSITSSPVALQGPSTPTTVGLSIRSATNSLLLDYVLNSTNGIFCIFGYSNLISLSSAGEVIYQSLASGATQGTIELTNDASAGQGFFAGLQFPDGSTNDLGPVIDDDEETNPNQYYLEALGSLGPLANGTAFALTVFVEDASQQVQSVDGVLNLSLISTNGEGPSFDYTIVPSQLSVEEGTATGTVAVMATNSLAGFTLSGEFLAAGPHAHATSVSCPTAIQSQPPPLAQYQDADLINWKYPLAQRYPIVGTFGEWPGHHTIHWGLDIGAPQFTQVLAAKRGIVTRWGTINGSCQVLIIDHGNGYSTAYRHIIPEVLPGSIVAAGQPIGEVGSSSFTGLPVHLHFEIIKNSSGPPNTGYRPNLGPIVGTPVNPISPSGQFQFTPPLTDSSLDQNQPQVKGGTVVENNPATEGYEFPVNNYFGESDITKGFFVATIVDAGSGHFLTPDYICFTPELGNPQVVDYQAGQAGIINFSNNPAVPGYAKYTALEIEYNAQGNKLIDNDRTAYKYWFNWDTTPYMNAPSGPRKASLHVRDIAGRTTDMTFTYGPQLTAAPLGNGDYSVQVTSHLGTNFGYGTLTAGKFSSPSAFETEDAYYLVLTDPNGGATFTSTGNKEFTTPYFTSHLATQNFIVHVPSSSDPSRVTVTANSLLLPNIQHRIALGGFTAMVNTTATVGYTSGYRDGTYVTIADNSIPSRQFVAVTGQTSYESDMETPRDLPVDTVYQGLLTQDVNYAADATATIAPGVMGGMVSATMRDGYGALGAIRGDGGGGTTVEGTTDIFCQYSGLVFTPNDTANPASSIPVGLNLAFSSPPVFGVAPTNVTYSGYATPQSSLSAEVTVSLTDATGGLITDAGSSTALWTGEANTMSCNDSGFASTCILDGSNHALAIQLGTLALNTPYTLTIHLRLDASVFYSVSSDRGQAQMEFPSTLSFPTDGTPVFSVPSGYTITAPSANIFGNTFSAP